MKDLEIILDLEWSLNQMTDTLVRERRGRFKTQTHRKEGHMKMEAETEVMLSQTKECKGCQQPPEGRRAEA